MTSRLPASGRNLVALAFALGACLAVPAVETAILHAQVQPLGPNQIAVGKPYKLAWDQAPLPDGQFYITYWQVVGQVGAATTKTPVGDKIPFDKLLNGGVTIELPTVANPAKGNLWVRAVNDPDPQNVTAAFTESQAFPVEYLKPVAIQPGAPTNLRKVAMLKLEGTIGSLGQIDVMATLFEVEVPVETK